MKALLLCTALLATSGAARAHVTLDQPEATAGSVYKAVFKVGHGCGGGAATKEIVVTLPAGLRHAKPVPKAGWTLALKRDANGELSEVRWAARSEADWLQDDWYDEFSLRAGLPAEPGELWFAVRQVCSEGEANWAERPTTDNPRPRMPAARLKLLPAH